jgi:hypothetical protein
VLHRRGRLGLEDCAARGSSRFGFAEAARRRPSDKSDRLLVPLCYKSQKNSKDLSWDKFESVAHVERAITNEVRRATI